MGSVRPHHDDSNIIQVKRPKSGRMSLSTAVSPDDVFSFERSTVADLNLTYPPTPVDKVDKAYDAEKAQPMLETTEKLSTQAKRPTPSRSSSWDILKKIERGYDQFHTRNASEPHLVFAEGDTPRNPAAKVYNYLLNVSIITRWTLFIVPVLGLLWIPGILGLTVYKEARVWDVKLIWWSIWLSVIWGGWWTSLAFARLLPAIIRATIGTVAVSTRRYIDWLRALQRYVALFTWTLATYVSYNPLIDIHQGDSASPRAQNTVNLIGRLALGSLWCSALLLFEKFAIQWIAAKFHQRSYSDRIADLKFAVKSLVTLYRHSRDMNGRQDALSPPGASTPGSNMAASTGKLLKAALKGVRTAATHTTTAFGNVASEIAGSSVLQPNSPQAIVAVALESANKSRLLARRIFYSFSKPGAEYLELEDITRYLRTCEEAEAVFALFDKDGNGDVTRDEVEMACMEFHREKLSIEHSMRDLDSAVGRLDNILMSLYVIVAGLIIAIVLQTQLLALVTGAGTLILGLSWLIGGSLQEVLTSIIFLFVKHPFDVGDRVNIEKEMYTVKEIRLLSTVFLDSNGVMVQAPNLVLNGKFIQNIRRSPQMSETFEFDVSYSTTFEQLETLREKMLAFVKSEGRDFQPAFDVVIAEFPDQQKMKLKADIKYKSNWQQGALKAKRRNKWVCALKTILAEIRIFGPNGDPSAIPGTVRYTVIPWDEVKAEDRKAMHEQRVQGGERLPPGGWQLSDKNAVILHSSEDVFGEENQLHMTNPRRGFSDETGTGRPPIATAFSSGIEQVPVTTPMPAPVARTRSRPDERGTR